MPQKFKHTAHTHHTFLAEVDPHRRNELGVKHAVCVLIEEARLPNARVADGQEFDKVVVIYRCRRHAEPTWHSHAFSSLLG